MEDTEIDEGIGIVDNGKIWKNICLGTEIVRGQNQENYSVLIGPVFETVLD